MLCRYPTTSIVIGDFNLDENQKNNRFRSLNNKIENIWFNESLDSFKVKCKKLFLQ